MINDRIIKFFSNHNLYNKEMFDYFKKNTTYYDYKNEDYRVFNGTFYKLDSNNILTGIHICVPIVEDDKTMLINIHEFVHAIEMYYNLGKKWIERDDTEVLPIFFEKIYIRENPSTELLKYEEYLNNCILSNKEEYIIAYKIYQRLINDYNYEDFNTLKRKIRSIIK